MAWSILCFVEVGTRKRILKNGFQLGKLRETNSLCHFCSLKKMLDELKKKLF